MQRDKPKKDFHLLTDATIIADPQSRSRMNNVFTHKNLKVHLTNLTERNTRGRRSSSSGNLQKTLYYYTRHPEEALKLRLPSLAAGHNNKGKRKSTDESNAPVISLNECAELPTSSSKVHGIPSRCENAAPFLAVVPKAVSQTSSSKSLTFQSPINKIRYELISGLGGLEPNTTEQEPSTERLKKVFGTLGRIAEERQVFGERLSLALVELRLAVYFGPGDFFKMFPLPEKYRKGIEGLQALDYTDNTYFGAMKQLAKLIVAHLDGVRNKEEGLRLEIEGKCRAIQERDRSIKQLQRTVEELRRANENPLHLQYQTVSEENSKLNQEISMLKYKIVTIQEELETSQKQCSEESSTKLKYAEKYKRLKNDHDRMSLFKEELEKRFELLRVDYTAKVEESKVVMEQVKKCKAKLEAQEKNSEALSSENHRLGLRAAISFDELTPRFKNFAGIFKELGIAPPKPDYKTLAETSSISYIETLVAAFKHRGKPFPKTCSASPSSHGEMSVGKAKDCTGD